MSSSVSYDNLNVHNQHMTLNLKAGTVRNELYSVVHYSAGGWGIRQTFHYLMDKK